MTNNPSDWRQLRRSLGYQTSLCTSPALFCRRVPRCSLALPISPRFPFLQTLVSIEADLSIDPSQDPQQCRRPVVYPLPCESSAFPDSCHSPRPSPSALPRGAAYLVTTPSYSLRCTSVLQSAYIPPWLQSPSSQVALDSLRQYQYANHQMCSRRRWCCGKGAPPRPSQRSCDATNTIHRPADLSAYLVYDQQVPQ